MRRVATAAALGLHRYMLVDERALLVDVALVADEIAAGEGLQLTDGSRPMRVVAVVALHQTLVDPVVIGFGKICFGRGMASVAQLRLLLNQQMLLFLGVMRRVAIQAADIAAGVSGFREVRLLREPAQTASNTTSTTAIAAANQYRFGDSFAGAARLGSSRTTASGSDASD